MKAASVCLFFVAGVAAFISGCASGPVSPPDTVRIVDVQSSEKSDSEYTPYKLKVGYELRSAEHAMVTVGFDLEEPGRYIVLSQQEVKKGSGKLDIRADVRLPKRSIVTIHADLSRLRHPSVWRSLASDDRVLTIAE